MATRYCPVSVRTDNVCAKSVPNMNDRQRNSSIHNLTILPMFRWTKFGQKPHTAKKAHTRSTEIWKPLHQYKLITQWTEKSFLDCIGTLDLQVYDKSLPESARIFSDWWCVQGMLLGLCGWWGGAPSAIHQLQALCKSSEILYRTIEKECPAIKRAELTPRYHLFGMGLRPCPILEVPGQQYANHLLVPGTSAV